MKTPVDEGMEELSHCSVQGTTRGVQRKLLICCHPAPVFDSYAFRVTVKLITLRGVLLKSMQLIFVSAAALYRFVSV